MDPQAHLGSPPPESSPSSPSSPSPPNQHPTELTGHDRPSSSASDGAPLPSSAPPSDALLHTPSADIERHPKGKRKRTAAKDKAILEEAYAANPKPDKAARLAIVNRVSLNEKEVQIWFQNRRQNDRRKSRPLSPQEIAALRYGGMQVLSSDPASYNSSFSSDNSQTSPLQAMSQSSQRVASPARSDPPGSSSGDDAQTSPCVPREIRPEETSEHTEVNNAAPVQFQPISSSASFPASAWNRSSSFSTPSTIGRRGDDSFGLEPFVPSSCSSVKSAGPILPPLSQGSSKIRLSFSLDGKAEVVESNSSPPRPLAPVPSTNELQSLGPIRRLSLQRSQSVSSPVTLPPISVLTNSLVAPRGVPPRLSRGRSRDVHAWEFCCDADEHEDFLTVQAKHESNGSAIAAISLIRSTSSIASPLQPSSSAKRNATTSRAAPRSGLAKKPRLSRALSSTAKLQTSTVGDRTNSDKVAPDAGKTKTLHVSGNESDKENWSPDEEGNPRFSFSQETHPGIASGGRRPLLSGITRWDKKNSRRTLAQFGQETRGSAPYLNGRANTAPAMSHTPRLGKRGQSPLPIFEDSENRSPAPHVDDDEVERFMRGDVSPSKKGDVDAVAGLLSLSQGNWR